VIGVVTLTKPISGNSSFLATATDGGLPRRRTTVPVYVYALPSNHHAPRFFGDRQTFITIVLEDRPVGYVVSRVSAVDPDQGDNGVVRYYITAGEKEFFSVDAVDGTLAVAKPLDYETRRRHDVELAARDLGVGGQSLEDRRVFTVMVTDVNDNPPQFSHDVYSMSVYEDAPAGTTLGQLDASDADRGLNAEVRFQIVSGNASLVVDVGELDGRVMTGMRELTPGLYVSIVQVTNPGTNLLSTAGLKVHVKPVNHHSPAFRRRQYVFTLPNVTVLTAGVVVGAVDATDSDSGVHGELQYFLSGDSNLGIFTVDRRTGFLSVATTTSNTVAATSLSILVKNHGPLRPGNFDVCTVMLRGGGSDGQMTLAFERLVYMTAVREDSAVGDPVVKVSAFIINPGTTARSTTTRLPSSVMYAISDGNTGGAFSVDSQTGLIFVAGKLHYDSLSKYNLTVSASINSAYPLTGMSMFLKLFNANCNANFSLSIGHIKLVCDIVIFDVVSLFIFMFSASVYSE